MHGDYSHKFDADRLLELIKQGKNATEIMKALDVSRWSLMEHLLILQNKTKQYYEIPGLFDEAGGERKKTQYQKEGIIFSAKNARKDRFQGRR